MANQLVRLLNCLKVFQFRKGDDFRMVKPAYIVETVLTENYTVVGFSRPSLIKRDTGNGVFPLRPNILTASSTVGSKSLAPHLSHTCAAHDSRMEIHKSPPKFYWNNYATHYWELIVSGDSEQMPFIGIRQFETFVVLLKGMSLHTEIGDAHTLTKAKRIAESYYKQTELVNSNGTVPIYYDRKPFTVNRKPFPVNQETIYQSHFIYFISLIKRTMLSTQ